MNITATPTKPQKTKSNEWYTPAKYIEAAREVMGSIDLDPASCALANETVKAARYFTIDDDGLSKAWDAKTLWLNPPFGRENAPPTGYGGGKSIMALFVAKLLCEYETENIEQATLLVSAKPDTAWFAPLWEYPICFATHRVLFDRPGSTREGHFFGTAFVYLGPNESKFIEVFSQFGIVARRVSPTA